MNTEKSLRETVNSTLDDVVALSSETMDRFCGLESFFIGHSSEVARKEEEGAAERKRDVAEDGWLSEILYRLRVIHQHLRRTRASADRFASAGFGESRKVEEYESVRVPVVRGVDDDDGNSGKVEARVTREIEPSYSDNVAFP